MSDSPLIQDQLAVTKFIIPSSSHALIARPRLIELLSRVSLHQRLTLISAPAGFGKTCLPKPEANRDLCAFYPEEGSKDMVSPLIFWKQAQRRNDRVYATRQWMAEKEKLN